MSNISSERQRLRLGQPLIANSFGPRTFLLAKGDIGRRRSSNRQLQLKYNEVVHSGSNLVYLRREGEDLVLDLVELAGGQDADVAILPAA